MPAAGVAFDGSVWVTAASSIGLVFGAAGLTAAGALLLGRAAEKGTLSSSFNEGAFARPQQSGRVVLKVDRSQLQNGQAKRPEPEDLTAAEEQPKNGKGQ